MSVLAKLHSLKERRIANKTKCILILSHMRSRSSVLAHVLGSNPDICGYSESHIPYSTYIDLIRLRTKISSDLKCDLKNKYLLDKILHNHLTISEEIIARTNSKIIFLIRDPKPTIKSNIEMGATSGIKWHSDPTEAANYYCLRLKHLENYAALTNGNHFFLCADNLINDTDSTLKNLSDWLELRAPLNNNYSVFPHTGKKGHGDPSDNIKSGIIKSTKGYPDINIPEEILQKAKDAFQKCKAKLS